VRCFLINSNIYNISQTHFILGLVFIIIRHYMFRPLFSAIIRCTFLYNIKLELQVVCKIILFSCILLVTIYICVDFSFNLRFFSIKYVYDVIYYCTGTVNVHFLSSFSFLGL
jgi:hypothetical protein